MTSEEFKNIRESMIPTMSQERLANFMGMYQSHIARIETGERAPTKIQAAFLEYIKDHPPL